MDQNERLIRHDRFMTTLMFDAAALLTEEQLDRPFDIGHGSVRLNLDHISVGLELWTSVMRGESPKWEPTPAAVEVMRTRNGVAYDEFVTLARSMIDRDMLDETFVDPWDTPQTYGATILHVILHSHVHRSELLGMFQRLGFNEFTQGDPQEWEHMAGVTLPQSDPVIKPPVAP